LREATLTVLLWTVAPLALLHLWLARRHPEVLRFQLLVDLLLLAVCGPALLTGRDLDPVRCLAGVRPFTSWQFAPETRYQPVQSDVVYQFHPWWAETRRQLLAGDLPSVSPRIGGGLPLLANGQTGLFAPVMLPVWALGPERGTTVMALWKLEAAAMGAYLLLLAGLRLPRTAASLGGVAWGGGQYLVAWLLVPLGWAVAALPWVWWGVLAAARRRSGPVRIVLTGLGLGWLLGAGLHPETSAAAVASALLAALVLHPRRWPRLAALATLAAASAAVLLLPTLLYARATARHVVNRDVNRARPSWALRAELAAQTLIPAVWGHPGRGDWTRPYPHAPAAAGVGGVVLGALAAGAALRRRRRLVIAGLAVLAMPLLLVYRLPPLDWLLVRLPPLDRMSLVRFQVLVPWALVLLAALAVEGLVRGRRRRWPALAALALALTAALVIARPLALVPASLAAVLATVALAIAVAVGGHRAPRLLPWLAAGELALLAWGLNPAAAPHDLLPEPPVMVELQRLVAAEGGRVAGLGGVLPPNLASRYGLADLRASDPLRPLPFTRLMSALGEAEPVLGGPLERAPSGLLGAWGVRWLLAAPGAWPGEGWQPVLADGDATLWRNDRTLPEVRVAGEVVSLPDAQARERLLDPGLDLSRTVVVPPGVSVHAGHGEILHLDERPARVAAEVACDGPCLLVVARPWAPGWRARVDGEPAALVRTNLAGLGTVVPAGRHTAALDYSPWRW